ncbi:MAG: Chaperone protein DnaJ [Fimbriimonadaceae bacterium]|nr:Chaperone protein DnaJ [Fimbriimonadaceae bacterium]
MGNLIDYYRVLNVDRTATESDIRKAYRFLVSFYHPDINHGEKAEYAAKKTVELNEAYAVLCDPKARAAYDQCFFANDSGSSESTWDPDTYQSPDDMAAQAAYESTQQFYELIGKGGFWDSVTGRTSEYRDRAVRQLETVVNRWPKSRWALQAQSDILGLYLTVEQDIPLAENAARTLGRMAPGSEFQDFATLGLAICYSRKGQPNHGLQLLRALLRKELTYEIRTEAEFVLGHLLHEGLCDHEAAIQQYVKFSVAYPEHCYAAQSIYLAGRIADSVLNQKPRAITLYEEVRRRYPSSEEASDCGWRIDYLRA